MRDVLFPFRKAERKDSCERFKHFRFDRFGGIKLFHEPFFFGENFAGLFVLFRAFGDAGGIGDESSSKRDFARFGIFKRVDRFVERKERLIIPFRGVFTIARRSGKLVEDERQRFVVREEESTRKTAS